MGNKLYTSIYVTEDYDKFKKLPANRDAKTAQRIIDSIKKVGYVLSPILVNEKFEVIDGQNRLLALKEMKLPVHYMIQPGIGIKECRALNIGQSNWTSRQFLESYAEDGSADYQRLRDLLLEFGDRVALEGIIYISHPILIPPAGNGNAYRVIRDGRWQMTEAGYARARKNVGLLLDLGSYELMRRCEVGARQWWGAMGYAVNHPKVNIRNLIDRLKKDPLSIVGCQRISDQLGYFDEAYNKGRTPEHRVYMKTDLLSGKYLK